MVFHEILIEMIAAGLLAVISKMLWKMLKELQGEPSAVYTSPFQDKFWFTSAQQGRLDLYEYDRRALVTKMLAPHVVTKVAPILTDDGSKLAFTSMMEGSPDVYVYHVKTGKIQRITNDPVMDRQLFWSRDKEGRHVLNWITEKDGKPVGKHYTLNDLCYNINYTLSSPEGQLDPNVHWCQADLGADVKHMPQTKELGDIS